MNNSMYQEEEEQSLMDRIFICGVVVLGPLSIVSTVAYVIRKNISRTLAKCSL